MKNEYEVTEKLFLSWVKESMLTGVRFKFKVFWSVLIAAAIVFCVIYNWNIIFILLAVFCLYRAFLRDFVTAKSQYMRLVKLHGNDKWVRTITFENDFICVNDGNASVKYYYTDITGIRESGNIIWLDTNKQGVIRLYKNAFKDGDCDQCINMIKSKYQYDYRRKEE